MSLEYNRKLIPLAKELRKNMTKQENHIWYNFLRKHPVRFQRQKTIGSYIVDFYCHKAKLVIEIDGSQHFTKEGIVHDTERTKVLNGFDLKVIRFTNNEVDKHFREVCTKIDTIINERIQINQ